MDPWVVNQLIIPLAGMATGIIIGAGFFKTVRHFIDRRGSSAADSELRGEIADLHARIDALEHGRDRFDELEDRLDFAERLLAKGSQSGAAAEER